MHQLWLEGGEFFAVAWPHFVIQQKKVPNLSLFFFSFFFPQAYPAGTARFSQEPADQSVVRGQRVILFCLLFNYSGIVQWTKDGLALGIGEDLQGETSYSHLGLPAVCPACD